MNFLDYNIYSIVNDGNAIEIGIYKKKITSQVRKDCFESNYNGSVK
jgi:hypothetical protein